MQWFFFFLKKRQKKTTMCMHLGGGTEKQVGKRDFNRMKGDYKFIKQKTPQWKIWVKS